MATQSQNNQKLNSRFVSAKDNDVILGALVSQKSGFDLMQNCDLPPPLKVFTGLDKAIALSMNASVYRMGREADEEFQGYGNEGDKLETLKALTLSRTREREAERKAAALVEEKERLLNVFMKDSLHLFAYRRWVRLLETQVSMLQSKLAKKEDSQHCCDEHDDMAWVVALALCLGFAFGCRFLF